MKEFALSLAIMLGSVSGLAVSASPALAQDLSNGADNFYKSDRVDVKSVTFQNQYNMKVAGHLFTPKDMQPREASSYPGLNAWIYSVDALLPVLEMDQKAYWRPNPSEPFGTVALNYFYFQSIVGWVLSLLAVAGFSGLVKSR